MPSTLTSYSPTPTVTLDGDTPDDFAARVLSVTVEESVHGLARAELRLDNWANTGDGPGYAFADRSTVDFGTSVEVKVGPPDERSTIFTGRVTGLEAEYAADTGPTLVVLAEDTLQDLRMTRRTRTFENSSDADVVERIANDHSLNPDVTLDGPTHEALCQLNQSDLAFLRDLALPHGADVWLDGSTLHIGTRDEEPVVLRHGREVLAARLLADLALQATEQRVAGWDPDSKEAVLETADQSSLGADLGSDKGGGGLLSDAFGDRIATTTVHRAVTSAEASELAKGLYRDRARRFVTGSLVADGIPGLRAGRTVTLADLGRMFDGTYRLTRVAHRYDLVTGYRTELEVERSGISA